jgi:nucleotide-binding universal stress UspA family protein
MNRTRITSIFHASDFSEASATAFVHALKIALVTEATLMMLHVDPNYGADWSDFPGVRTTLERWGLIPKGSPKSAVGRLGIDVTKVIATSSRPVKACLDFLSKHPAELIVLAIHQYEGNVRWLQKRVAEPVAHAAGQMTLFIPEGVPGFVSPDDGSISLHNILIPVAKKPHAQPAVDAVVRMIHALQLPAGNVTLLHAGPAEEIPALQVAADPGWNWKFKARDGEPVEVILQAATDASADLIVMTTEGSHGFLDALRGSTSTRVLRACSCPVLSLHVEPR